MSFDAKAMRRLMETATDDDLERLLAGYAIGFVASHLLGLMPPESALQTIETMRAAITERMKTETMEKPS